jgi:hypothetical protein
MGVPDTNAVRREACGRAVDLDPLGMVTIGLGLFGVLCSRGR